MHLLRKMLYCSGIYMTSLMLCNVWIKEKRKKQKTNIVTVVLMPCIIALCVSFESEV